MNEQQLDLNLNADVKKELRECERRAEAETEVPCDGSVDCFLEETFQRLLAAMLRGRTDLVTLPEPIMKRLIERAWEMSTLAAATWAAFSVPASGQIRRDAVEARVRLKKSLSEILP